MNDLPESGVSGTITEMRQQVNDPTRWSVFIDGEFAFGVSQEIMQRYVLVRDKQLSSNDVREIVSEEGFQKLKNVAINYLRPRLRSRQEIERRLKKVEDVAPEAIDRAVAWLQEYRMIDDANLAEAYINDQTLKRPVGRVRLRNDLRKLGVADELIEQALLERLPNERELELAREAVKKKLSTIRHPPGPKRSAALSRFLQGRGFPFDLIGTVIREVDVDGVE